MRTILFTAIAAVLLFSCNVAQKEAATADSCGKAADCAGKGLTKGPCDGAWACNAGACEWTCSGAVRKGWCEKAADCEGLGLAQPSCEGAWQCQDNVCGYACSNSGGGGGTGGLDGGTTPADGGSATMGCLSNADCPPDTICVRDPSRPYGSCETATDCACDASWAPVCGADGRTWPNRGCATCGGAAVAYEGECRFCAPIEPAAASCGDGYLVPAENSDGCPLGLQCVACGCAIGPAVCGTDGTTYASACIASCAGVAVAAQGACTGGCSTGAECPQDLVCAVQDRCPLSACASRCVKAPECAADADCGVPVKDCGCGAACVEGNCYELCWQCNSAGLTCASDGDCVEAGLPQKDCQAGTGAWLCLNAMCEWTCTPDVGGCSSEYDPATGRTCTTCTDQQGTVTKKCG